MQNTCQRSITFNAMCVCVCMCVSSTDPPDEIKSEESECLSSLGELVTEETGEEKSENLRAENNESE